MADEAAEDVEEATDPSTVPIYSELQDEDEKVIKETSYLNEGIAESAGAGPEVGGSAATVGSAGEGSLVSNIPLTDDDILEQLKNLDAEAQKRAAKIQLMRDSITHYQEAEHMTNEIAQKLERKQRDLIAELQEFDRITVEIQRLIGIAEASGIFLTPSVEGAPGMEKPTMRKGPAAKEIGFVVYGVPGNIPEYLTDRTPKIVTATYLDGVPRIIMLDSPRKGGACQPLAIEGLDALARKNARNELQSAANGRSAAAPCEYSPSYQPVCPPPINIGSMLQGKFQCLQGEIDQLRDENGKLNNLIVQLVQDSLQAKCPSPPCAPQRSHPPPCFLPPCISPPASRSQPCPVPPCSQLPCCSPPCPSAPSPSKSCTNLPNTMCPAFLAQQMDKLEEELQELQQLLACERMEVELDKLKQLKASCKNMPCSLLPRCPPKPCK